MPPILSPGTPRGTPFRAARQTRDGRLVFTEDCMSAARYTLVAVVALGLAAADRPGVSAQAGSAPTIAQFLGAPSPIEVVSARNVDRVAWIAYEEGKRNVYTAAAPAFAPVRLTKY